jgi:hypothetical protein
MSALDVDLCVVDMVDHRRCWIAGSDVVSMARGGGGGRPCFLNYS